MVTNIPVIFLHVDMEATVHMILEGEISEIIINLKLNITKTYGITTRERQ